MTDHGANGAGNERHRVRMQRQKELVDAKMDHAQRDQGVIIAITGNGKGKSSSGFGMVARALGNRMKVGVVQFIKGAIPTGDEKFFRRFPGEVEYHVVGEGYTWETQDRDRDIANAEAGWTKAKALLNNTEIGLVLLDELNIALNCHYLNIEQVIADIQHRPPMQHVVITGRGAPLQILNIAHTVSDIKAVKHAFDHGIRAQKGVEL